jgi:hypothetical protein
MNAYRLALILHVWLSKTDFSTYERIDEHDNGGSTSKLTPAAYHNATASALMSTLNGICPTTAVPGETMQFQMD